MRTGLLVIVLACAAVGCNALLGLEKTVEVETPPGPDDAPVTGDSGPCEPIDDGKECTEDLCVDNAPVNMPVEAGKGCTGGTCDAAGNCIQCVMDSDCGPMPMGSECADAPRCIDGTCTISPAPAGTFCNGFVDQCDGMGNCVDCTNNGGCDECCVCLNNVCIPA